MINRLTAYIIGNNPAAKATVGGPDEDGKYTGWVILDIDRWHPLLSTPPAFKTKKAALKCMENVVKICKQFVKDEIEEHGDLMSAAGLPDRFIGSIQEVIKIANQADGEGGGG